MPSFHEGFGLVAWEAMSMGIPIIISENSGIYQLLERLNISDKVGSLKISGLDEDHSEADVIALSEVIQPRLINAKKYHDDANQLRLKVKELCGNESLKKIAVYIDSNCISVRA